MPQSASANRDEQTKLAYEALHERTGSQGRLKHVQCLELGGWNSGPPPFPSFSLQSPLTMSHRQSLRH